jgi:hypothetical protein
MLHKEAVALVAIITIKVVLEVTLAIAAAFISAGRTLFFTHFVRM